MQKKLVYVGMSGGVDSSVAAALLKKRSFDVIGVFMKNWHSRHKQFKDICPWEQDLRDAKTVAARLDIPLKVWNFEKLYHDKVVKYFFDEYRAGRTPNPDVMCNKEIKFKAFYQKAIKAGADYIATGHYSRVSANIKYQIPNTKSKRVFLYAAEDNNKDQSYFLWNINRRVLNKVLFPIGNLTKPEVRSIAKKFNLPVHDKKDSQGICFIGPINVKEYLKTELPIKKGDIVDEQNHKIGDHEGVWFYTEGQRQGIGARGNTIPQYVVKKDIKNNKLIVGGRKSRALFAKKLIVKKINWLINSPLLYRILQERSEAKKIGARIRYRHPIVPCRIAIRKGEASIAFSEPQRAITPGQSIVFYLDDVVLGGGIIDRIL